MTVYMLSVHNDGTQDFESMPPEVLQQIYADVDAFNDEIKRAGKWVFAGGLEGIETATVVDGAGDAPVITDGPCVHALAPAEIERLASSGSTCPPSVRTQ